MTVWKYLQDEQMQMFHLNKGWWYALIGKIYERTGKMIIREHREAFNKIFENFETVSSEFVPRNKFKDKKILFGAYKIRTPDYVYLLHGKNGDNYEKRAVVFEIKSGTSPINKQHIDFWKDLLKNPSKYIEKCIELRLYIMWIYGFDFDAHNLFYSFKDIKSEEIPPPDQDSTFKGD